MAFKTIAEFADETGTAVVDHINDIFAAGPVVGTNYTQLLQGVNITNSVFYSRLPLLYAKVPAANISIIDLDWQPIGSLLMAASAAGGGNALGLDPCKVYLCWAEVVEWTTTSPRGSRTPRPPSMLLPRPKASTRALRTWAIRRDSKPRASMLDMAVRTRLGC
jgi:hypothetical protein